MTTFHILQRASDLALFVQHYWRLEGEQPGTDADPIFPDGAPELVFNLGALVRQLDEHSDWPTHQPRAMLVGQLTRTVWVAPAGPVRMVGVKLTPWGAAGFFGAEASQWRNRLVDLRDLWRGADTLLAKLAASHASDDRRVADLLDHCLHERLTAVAASQRARTTAVALALRQPTGGSIASWARGLGWSTRTFERRFDDYVGLSAKELFRLNRFQRALRLGTEQPRLTLGTVAAQVGYADHSHLVREFRAFAGAPPGKALAAATSISLQFLSEPQE